MSVLKAPLAGPPASQEPLPVARRNFWAWVAYQFFYRIGWQFKMEATLMAGLISFLAPGSPILMGLFTSVNTVGRNLSPLLAAPAVDRFRAKRSALLLFWSVTTLVWMALTLYLWTPTAGDRRVSLWVFGVCYTLFFLFLGAASVAQGALLGRIIPANRRGRALAMGMGLSGGINVVTIYLIYRVLLGGAFPEPKNYALAFTFTCAFFVMAGGSLFFIRETPGESVVREFKPASSLRYFAQLARGNPDLSRLMVVNAAVSVGGSMLQFYTGFWRVGGALTEQTLMMATVTQVFWQSLASSVVGRITDRIGNKRVIVWLLCVETAVPAAAWILGGWDPFRAHWAWYLGVFALIGIRFPVYQLLVNYLLEIAPSREHAMALGAVTTVQLLTAPAPILLGAVAQAWSYPAAFALAAVCMAWAAMTARSMREPRAEELRADDVPG